MLDLLIVAGVTFLPTLALAGLASIIRLVVAVLSGRPFAWATQLNAFFAASRLQVAALLLGIPVVGLLLGKWLYLGVVPVVALVAMIVGAAGFLTFAARGIPAWASWPAWRRILSWPFRTD